MWPFSHKTDTDEPPLLPTEREAVIRGAEQRATELEARADRVEESLWGRLRQNNFAEGILLSFIGPHTKAPSHRRGGS